MHCKSYRPYRVALNQNMMAAKHQPAKGTQVEIIKRATMTLVGPNVGNVMGREHEVPDGDVQIATAAPEEYYAKKVYQCSADLMIRWVAADGCVRCSATNRTGKRCRNGITIDSDPKEWLAQFNCGFLCHVHS